MKKMFEISKDVVEDFSKLGEIHNEIYLFIENHSQDIELSLDKLYKKKEIIIDKKHTSFTTNKEYSFFKIIKYSK